MGLSEEFIMNELPLAKGYQYIHCIYRSYDNETYYPKDEIEMEENLQLLEDIISNSEEADLE